jgi:Branched-chain amino acid transport protein (AzlD)
VIGWGAVLLACAGVFLIKLAGHLAPARVLAQPQVLRVAGLVTAGLLAALVAVQTLADGTHLHPDARLPALAVAAIALCRRAPFIVVVLLAALTAAALRTLGLP